MEISGKVPPLDKTPYIKQANGVTKQPASSPTSKGDRVDISDRARELQAARKAVAEMDDVDHEKVARIKAQVQAGTYKVDAARTAAKMIDQSLLDDLG